VRQAAEGDFGKTKAAWSEWQAQQRVPDFPGARCIVRPGANGPWPSFTWHKGMSSPEVSLTLTVGWVGRWSGSAPHRDILALQIFLGDQL
jgi:hypothetical protein